MVELTINEQKQINAGTYVACIFKKSDDSLVKSKKFSSKSKAMKWIEQNCIQSTQYGFLYED